MCVQQTSEYEFVERYCADVAERKYQENLRAKGPNVIKLVVQGRSIGFTRIFKERFGKNFQRLSSKNRRRELRQKKIRENSQRAEV